MCILNRNVSSRRTISPLCMRAVFPPLPLSRSAPQAGGKKIDSDSSAGTGCVCSSQKECLTIRLQRPRALGGFEPSYACKYLASESESELGGEPWIRTKKACKNRCFLGGPCCQGELRCWLLRQIYRLVGHHTPYSPKLVGDSLSPILFVHRAPSSFKWKKHLRG
jgi:hypothetical protein